MTKILFRGTIRRGIPHLDPKDEVMWQACLKSLEGKRFEMTLAAERKDVTYKQLKYYNVVIIRYCRNHFGYTKKEMKVEFRKKFMQTYDPQKPYQSEEELSTAEFEEVMDEIRQWMLQEYNVNIPRPNEVNV